jgi:hypothetical protein
LKTRRRKEKILYLFTLRGGTGTGGEAHRGPHAQEQLRANVQPARSQGYQQQGRVSAMRTTKLKGERNENI